MDTVPPWVWIVVLSGPSLVLMLSIFVNLLLMLVRRGESKRRLRLAGLSLLLMVLCSVVERSVFRAFFIPSPAMLETLQIQDRILVNKLAYRSTPPGRGDIVVFQPPARATDRQEDLWIKRVIGVPGDRIAVRNNQLFLNEVQQREPFVALLQRGSDREGEIHQSSGRYDYIFPNPEKIDLQTGQNAYIYPAGPEAIASQFYRAEPTRDAFPRAPKGEDDYLFFVRNDPKEGLEVVVPPGQLFVMGDNRNDSEDSHYWGYLDQKRVLGQAICIFWPTSRMRNLTQPDH